MAKLGIRGTATGRLAFNNMRVPAENVLGSPGEGLKLALTVLDFGRTTFGACCTGAAKTCLRLAVAHATTREQFGMYSQRLRADQEEDRGNGRGHVRDGSHDHGDGIADRSGPRGLHDRDRHAQGLHDRGAVDDRQRHLSNPWGAAYFTDLPLERMLRDARINQIGEGANEVLTSFIALAGMRGPGVQLRDLWHALHHPLADLGTVWRFGVERVSAAVRAPDVPVRDPRLSPYAQRVGKLIRRLNIEVSRVLIHHRESVLDRQYGTAVHCGGSRRVVRVCLCPQPSGRRAGCDSGSEGRRHESRGLCLRRSLRRVRRWLAKLHDNDDLLVTAAADAALGE